MIFWHYLALAAVGAARDCGAECRILHGQLDPVRACSLVVRNAMRRGEASHSASNACLKSFMAAFRDECQQACTSDDQWIEIIPGRHDEGYLAGIRQTRAFFGIREPTSTNTPQATSTTTKSVLRRETVSVVYRGERSLVSIENQQSLQDAAKTWCKKNDDTRECPRILLLSLQQADNGASSYL